MDAAEIFFGMLFAICLGLCVGLLILVTSYDNGYEEKCVIKNTTTQVDDKFCDYEMDGYKRVEVPKK